MDQANRNELSPELQAVVFQGVGAFDILLGAALALLGPGYVGGEPVVDLCLRIGGAILGVSGVGIIAWARARARHSQDEPDSGSLFKAKG